MPSREQRLSLARVQRQGSNRSHYFVHVHCSSYCAYELRQPRFEERIGWKSLEIASARLLRYLQIKLGGAVQCTLYWRRIMLLNKLELRTGSGPEKQYHFQYSTVLYCNLSLTSVNIPFSYDFLFFPFASIQPLHSDKEGVGWA